MFKATKPFKDKITNYPKEPSLRIGRTVPKNAVNLAYYYNPTATDAEKVLTAEAPRNTIDHRVEEAYRYLFDQASDDDDLFPGSVWYEDEEGYTGRLGRMYVNWYPEAHIEVKNVQQTKDVIVINKSELPKMIEYSDAYDYHGNLYLDAASFEVTKWRDVTVQEVLDREVFDHEISFHEVFGTYISSSDLDSWMNPPTSTANTLWPKSITVTNKLKASGGNNKVVQFIDNMSNPYDDAIGELVFDSLEYEQVYVGGMSNGQKIGPTKIGSKFKSSDYKWTGDINDTDAITKCNNFIKEKEDEVHGYFKGTYCATYNSQTDKYDYTEINNFLSIADTYLAAQPASGKNFYKNIKKAMEDNKDIAIYLDRLDMVIDNQNDVNSKFHFNGIYYYSIADRGNMGDITTYRYNVIAKYKGVLKKTVTRVKEVAAEYKASCSYVGIARKVWYDYDGIAYYRGAVTKGNGMGNVNPENDNELLMFSDDKGYLRRPVWVTDENGETSIKNFYRVEADYVYLTDVFKNNKACFYKYPLKMPIYDYRGPDSMGFYTGDAVKIFTAGLKDIPEGYEHNLKLSVAEYETVDDITDDFQLTTKEIPKRYNAELYTSFISTPTDTFKVTYNAFDDNDTDNVALNSGVQEEIYNYPFMVKGKDFFMEEVDSKARTNKIYLPKPYRLRDSRRYITFDYKIVATRKGKTKVDDTGKTVIDKPECIIESEIYTASILNKDYALPCEYNKFDGRGFIISPIQDGIYLSPFDIILRDQAAKKEETKITSKDTDFIFSVTIISISPLQRGGVNIKCNPDGSGILTAETTIDTGFIDGNIDLWDIDENINFDSPETYTFTRKLNLESPYFVEDGWIYPGIKVKCVDSRLIKVNAPREEGLLQSWYPMIQFGHYSQIMDQYGTHVKVCYTMPEYDKQHYSSKFGKPYVDVKEEKVEILNSHMVKTECFPLFINEGETTISLFKRLDNEYFEIQIQDISFSDGIIITKDTISENDNIVCNYTYVEENYIYRGYWRNHDDFCRIDLNPNTYHTYSDMNYTPSETKPSKNLFNKVIYFFMKPTVEYEVSAKNDSLIYDPEDDEEIGTVIAQNKETLYHKIDDPQPDSTHDIYIGSVYIRQNTSLHSTILIDSRTRGGGILESISDSLRHELEPESDFYLDIGYYDGEPYQENGVIIVRLDNSLLKEFGGRFTHSEIEQKVKRWLGFGVYPIIEYVDSYSKRDMPQYNLTIEDSYTNVTPETPEIQLDCVSVS